MEQIKLDNISKTFTVYKRVKNAGGFLSSLWKRDVQQVHALQNISFSIARGELVGYIGPNGAGKSTTIKIMSGILTPSSGTCCINGAVPWKERTSHVSGLGVVFGQRSQLWWDVPVEDSFSLLRKIYRINDAAYQKRLSELKNALDIGSLLTTPVRQLSLGQRMRCEVAAALLHKPSILFLDEPTIGLDAVSKLALRQFLREENRKRETTMILTTHDMDDIEALCSRVMVIGKGRLLYDGNMELLKEKYAPLHCMTIKTHSENLCTVRDTLHKISGISQIRKQAGELAVWFHPREQSAASLLAAATEHCSIQDVVIQEQNIDEIIALMYEKMQLTETAS